MAEPAAQQPVSGQPSSPESFELADRSVLVCGAGLAGRSAIRALLRHRARVLVMDAATALEPLPAGAAFLGVSDVVPEGVDLVVTSPGFRPDSPILRHAALSGIPVWGEVEFAWRLAMHSTGRAHAARWLALTGTNGKTTTVRMLESILRAAGEKALAVGNVGVSVIDAVELGDWDVLAVELSSFQLHWSQTLRPRAGALLNLAPDHLDWHSTMADYLAAKTKVWDAEVAIGNADDPVVAAALQDKLLRRPATRGVTVTLGEPAQGQLGVREGWLVDAAFAAQPTPIIEAQRIRPAGAHNVANALFAAALALVEGVSHQQIAQGLLDFLPDPHRNQLLGTRAGVRFVDDSKATNPHAAAASLGAYESVVWIAGGQLKDAPVAELVATYGARMRAAVLLGADRAVIAAALARHAPDVPVFQIDRTDDKAMMEVVRSALAVAHAGDTVLLAPAAASYDMFTGYPARGAAFAAAVRRFGPLDGESPDGDDSSGTDATSG